MSEARQNGGGDPVRLLHRRSDHGYTDKRWLAMPGEPEAVSETDQAWLTDRAKTDERERRREEWRPFGQLLLHLIAEVEQRPFAAVIRDDLRALRRGVERTGKRL